MQTGDSSVRKPKGYSKSSRQLLIISMTYYLSMIEKQTSWLLPAAIIALALVLAAAEPPIIEVPEPDERNFTLTSTELTITPGGETAYLRFAGNVTVSSTGTDRGTLNITADVVELDVETGSAIGELDINLPEVAEKDVRIVSDPSQVIAEMAREMKLPHAQFSGSSLRRFGAAGNVEVRSGMGVLRTSSLVSTDGGNTWAAEERSSFTHTVELPAKHSQAIASQLPTALAVTGAAAGPGAQTLIVEFAADYLLYGAASGSALARGGIIGDISAASPDGPQLLLHLEAERFEMDLEAQVLSVSEGLRIRAGDMGMCCGELSANLLEQRIMATDGPHLEDRAQGITIDADVIEVSIDGKEAIAHGDVLVMVPQRKLRVQAVEVVVTRQENSYHAVCRYAEASVGESEFHGERVEMHLAGDRLVIEVKGEQNYRLDMREQEQSKTLEP